MTVGTGVQGAGLVAIDRFGSRAPIPLVPLLAPLFLGVLGGVGFLIRRSGGRRRMGRVPLGLQKKVEVSQGFRFVVS